jgi:hypothetical protein
MDAGKGPESPGRLPAAVGSPAGADDGGGGGLAQEASKTAVAIIGASRAKPMECTARIDGIQGNIMALLLLEALGALLLLVFIVWWTMFSGRKNGELKDPEQPAPGEESGKK